MIAPVLWMDCSSNALLCGSGSGKPPVLQALPADAEGFLRTDAGSGHEPVQRHAHVVDDLAHVPSTNHLWRAAPPDIVKFVAPSRWSLGSGKCGML
jgi:hypothetical protein